MYEIRFAAGLVHDLDALRSAERRLVLDGIQRKIRHEPTRPTKHVKWLQKLLPPFEHVPPIWQLRIGEHRVFYDVNEVEKMVLRARGSTQAAPHDDGADSMKTISVRDLQKHIKEVVDSAQHDRVVVTRHGEPAAVLLGVAGKDWETVVLETSPAFWDLIETRRKEPTLSADEVERRIVKST